MRALVSSGGIVGPNGKKARKMARCEVVIPVLTGMGVLIEQKRK
jgi:hypothetical protein